MHVFFLGLGTRGDIQPLVAFGVGLQASGHTVQVATQETYQEVVTSNGLGFSPVAIDLRAHLQAQKKSGDLPLRLQYQLTRQYMQQFLLKTWQAGQDIDALICSPAARIAGYCLAEKFNIPMFLALVSPFQMSSLYRPSTFGKPGGWGKRLLREQMLWQLLWRKPVNQWRQQVLGLPPAPFLGIDQKLRERRIPAFYALSSTLLPRPSTWPPQLHVTGDWFLDHPFGWSPPTELLNFLDSGPPPIVVTFGSMSGEDTKIMTERVLSALTLTKQRGILASGWSDSGQRIALPETVYSIGFVPYSWLFPKAAALIHHGGAGTTTAGLKAGRPTIIIPFAFSDQRYWARRVAELGAGPPPVSTRNLTPEQLAQSIDLAIMDEGIKRRAADISQQMQAEDGVREAEELFNHYVNTYPW